MNVTGVFRPADGQPPAAVETVTLSIYADEVGGTPLWQETQTVTLDERGRYTVLLGVTRAEGIPPAAFASGAQWLGTRFERAGEVEGPRVRLTSVPYALRAADADTLGGRPASDYRAGDRERERTRRRGHRRIRRSRRPTGELPGTPGASPSTLTPATSGRPPSPRPAAQVGIGTTTPFDLLHVRYTNTGGTPPASPCRTWATRPPRYSGMLFYDQNGALGQFQGLQQRHPRIPHQQRRHGPHRLDQFHGRQRLQVLRGRQRQHRHRHHRAVGDARSQQCDPWRPRQHVDDQLHERGQSLLHGTASPRHGWRAHRRAVR